jgi:hypothetical protein
MTVLDERECCCMALIPTPAKTVLILLIRVPSIFYYSAELMDKKCFSVFSYSKTIIGSRE